MEQVHHAKVKHHNEPAVEKGEQDPMSVVNSNIFICQQAVILEVKSALRVSARVINSRCLNREYKLHEVNLADLFTFAVSIPLFLDLLDVKVPCALVNILELLSLSAKGQVLNALGFDVASYKTDCLKF